MPDQPTFVVNDRRKFTSEGELRHESTSSGTTAEPPTSRPEAEAPSSAAFENERKGPQLVGTEAAAPAVPESALADLPESSAMEAAEPGFEQDEPEVFPDDALPPGPTEEQAAEAARAYAATVDRLETAIRASNPGGERIPEMTFERLVQSLYTQALLLLGGGAEPGETPRVDILGARQTIDMLAVLSVKTKGNLSKSEEQLLQSALFDLQMGFLEITQALARQAAQRQTAPGGMPGPGARPQIVR